MGSARKESASKFSCFMKGALFDRDAGLGEDVGDEDLHSGARAE